MKHHNLSKFLFLIIASIGIFFTVINFQATTSSAATSYRISSFPVRMRHTWYHYDGNGHYDKTTFGKYRVKYTEYWGGRYHRSRGHRVRITYLKGYKGKWINVMGLHQTAGDGEYYKLTHHRGHVALKSAHGAGVWADGYWYRGHVR